LRLRGALLATCVVASCALVAIARAEPEASTDTGAQLKAVEKDLQASQAEHDQLKRESVSVARELLQAQERKVSLAKEIQDQEFAIQELEKHIARLETEANMRGAALMRRDAQMGQTLLALERLALHPADALMLTPLAPEDAVRAAILLRAAVPEIVLSTTALQKELSDLYRRRSAIVAEREKIANAAAGLVEKRARLDAMIEKKSERHVTVVSRSRDMEVRVGELSRRAEDLRALFAKLAEEKARRQEEERLARAAEAARRAEEKVASKGRVERDDSDATAKPFTKAKGTMPFPAVGKLVTRYGEGSGNGPLTKGITLATRGGATVVSPYDGLVAFAGPFRGYGELVIVEHSEGYHTLIAGFGRIDATVGQRVLAGEPVGVMADAQAPTLYVELRRDGQPINPLPWLTARR